MGPAKMTRPFIALYKPRLPILYKRTQRLQNPLTKEYTLNYNRNPNKIWVQGLGF